MTTEEREEKQEHWDTVYIYTNKSTSNNKSCHERKIEFKYYYKYTKDYVNKGG